MLPICLSQRSDSQNQKPQNVSKFAKWYSEDYVIAVLK